MRGVRTLLLILPLLTFAAQAAAQGRGVRGPGDYDFFVLSLSWSPTYCLTEGTAADRLQCGPGRRLGFIVHGLWPQFERGYPEYCNIGPREAPARSVRDILDVIPSEDLARHQWRKHGTCSGMTPEGYFALTREARSRVNIPPALRQLDRRAVEAPGDIEQAFLRANPGLPDDGIAVTCGLQHFKEVRICLTKDMSFRSCPEVDARACGARSVTVPPVQ